MQARTHARTYTLAFSITGVLQVVLLDARLVEIGHNLKNFVKLGGSKQAHRDFDALHATDVMAHGVRILCDCVVGFEYLTLTAKIKF